MAYETERLESAMVDVGDKIRYRNYLQEFEGKVCGPAVVIDIIRVRVQHGHRDYFILNDNGNIRSVHHSAVFSLVPEE